jgi:hypothetical protein
MESILMVLGAISLVVGLTVGWFCYSRASEQAVQSSMFNSHLTSSISNPWMFGSFVGLVLMLIGMFAIGASLIGMEPIRQAIVWYKGVFG